MPFGQIAPTGIKTKNPRQNSKANNARRKLKAKYLKPKKSPQRQRAFLQQASDTLR